MDDLQKDAGKVDPCAALAKAAEDFWKAVANNDNAAAYTAHSNYLAALKGGDCPKPQNPPPDEFTGIEDLPEDDG